jgi:hypothetical protein
MVNGLKLFQEAFENYSDQYILIGGTACDLLLDEAGLPFRATRDLDIVLCIEALDEAFVRRFWQFVGDGGYVIKEKAQSQSRCLYRFAQPVQSSYSAVLELFSRRPEIFHGVDLSQITPVAVDENRVSLSAILLDDQYYEFIQTQKIEQAGLSLLSAPGLIALKAKAWLDLSERKQKGEQVDGADIRKHKNDVFRMFQIVESAPLKDVPEQIRQDMALFLAAMEAEEVDLRQLGIRTAVKSDVLAGLRSIYCY